MTINEKHSEPVLVRGWFDWFEQRVKMAFEDMYPECRILSDGDNMFVAVNGHLIAQRGRNGTTQAGQWTALEPGYDVSSEPGRAMLVRVNYYGKYLCAGLSRLNTNEEAGNDEASR